LLRKERLIVLTRAPAPSRRPHAILASEPFIRLDRKLWPGRRVDSYLRKAGIVPRERFEINSFEAITVMVDRGLGVSLLPEWSPPWPEGLSLAKLPVPDRSLCQLHRSCTAQGFAPASISARVPGTGGGGRRRRDPREKSESARQ
jgi:DNA-binding transcriptional LysR family regulator